MLDNEPNDPNDTPDRIDPFSSSDASQPGVAEGEPAPTKVSRKRKPPPPVVSFMAPPDPEESPPRKRAGTRSTDFVDGADDEPEDSARVAKRTRASAKATVAKAGQDVAPAEPVKAAKAAKAVKGTRARAAKATKAVSTDADGAANPANDYDKGDAGSGTSGEGDGESDADLDSGNRRRRGRRGRGRGKADDSDGQGSDGPAAPDDGAEDANADTDGPDSDDGPNSSGADDDTDGESSTRRRRRRRRRTDDDEAEGEGDSPGAGSGRARGGVRSNAGTRGDGDGRGDKGGGNEEVRGISGSTRLEAKRQRRRDGRDTGRRRAPILSEAEFLARREAVDRTMVIRQTGERTQIAVLEDDIVVEHYITQASSNSFAGNVYLGKVQNVLPSMEAAFVDIGKGRNAVLYAGEVNWDAAGLEGKSRNIETAMKSGDSVVVQVTKDPLGHKGARLTSQVSLPGRYLVFVPNGSMTGISRKLPDVERSRLKAILKKIVPEDAGVIIRTAAEGASEEELTRDVNRLTAQWEVIQKKAASSSTSSPSLLYQEPDLAIRVIRDVFNEDFARMIVAGGDAWDTVEAYVAHVAPDLADRVVRHVGESDVFADLRVDEQLAKALDRKVWLPSGGSLVIDRTEAMTVVDVNTGKYIGSGGNLEQTVTRNNLEAAEEIVRQLRLRDVGGIIVIDFVDMVLESNRDLVLRRLTECLGRDRTRHQVAEVTSLGLVQMTRKRVGQGLLEVYSEPCEHCNGRGIVVHVDPIDEKRRRSSGDGSRRDGSRDDNSRGDNSRGDGSRGDGSRGDGSRGDGSRGDGSRDDNGGSETRAGDGGERANGRRGRGRSAARGEGPSADADIAVVVSDPGQIKTDDSAAAPVRAESADVLAWTEQESPAAGQAVTATPRRRGRRAASRPAGPPDAES